MRRNPQGKLANSRCNRAKSARSTSLSSSASKNRAQATAVGGGSVIDTAKMIKIFSANKGNPESYIRGEKEIEKSGPPMVAVPTTSGTGSESTHFAVVYIGKTKYSLAHKEHVLPEYAIVDPKFTYCLPKRITAETGIDALGQAIESYWAVGSTDESKGYAREAIKPHVYGSKITGAGGGGCFIALCRPGRSKDTIEVLKKKGFDAFMAGITAKGHYTEK